MPVTEHEQGRKLWFSVLLKVVMAMLMSFWTRKRSKTSRFGWRNGSDDSQCVWVKTSQLLRPLPSSRYAPSIWQQRRKKANTCQASRTRRHRFPRLQPRRGAWRERERETPAAEASGRWLTWYADVAAPKRNSGGNSLRSTPRAAGSASASAAATTITASAVATAIFYIARALAAAATSSAISPPRRRRVLASASDARAPPRPRFLGFRCSSRAAYIEALDRARPPRRVAPARWHVLARRRARRPICAREGDDQVCCARGASGSPGRARPAPDDPPDPTEAGGPARVSTSAPGAREAHVTTT